MIQKCTLAIFTFISLSLAAQENSYWSKVNEATMNQDVFAISGTKRPLQYHLFRMEAALFSASLSTAASETVIPAAQSSCIIRFPDATGALQSFRVVSAPCFSPELAAKYPGIQSYAGKGIEDPSATIRFSYSEFGLHATMMSAGKPTVYIDRLTGAYYRVVRRTDIMGSGDKFECLTELADIPVPDAGQGMENVTDGKLRIYRLAMLSGGEFSLHFIPPGGFPTRADSINAVLAALNTHMTRANAVYERDVAIRMLLVPNNDLIIYLNPATDPISNPNSPSGSAMQTAIDGAIGSANYDIGHTVSKGSNNGNAGCIGCVCTSGMKARGWTVYSDPSQTEYYVIDYLTHEMGHQFGANHTFSFNTEGTGVNIEPGSGVTIMGYAGIVAGQNVAMHSIEIFSVKSIEQMSNYILNGGGSGCDQEVVTGNNPPSANAGSDYSIPHSTPFKLTGTSTDPDPGDVLKYNWEQIDNRSGANPSIPSPSATDGPMFRTYLDYAVPERTFPELQYILTGANGFTWEVLPAVTRPLNFRFISKDNHPGGGATQSDNMVVNVIGSAGPFAVTSPNSAVSWVAGSQYPITWSVNGSNNAPVNCANVKISLSTDGGFTFPTVLAASTANDGSENVTFPCVNTTLARIKVEAVGNIFFDISNSNFNIQPGFDFTSPAPVLSGCPLPASMSVTLGTLASCGFSNSISLGATGAPPGTNVTFSTNPVLPGNSTIVTLNGTNTLSPGTYVISIIGTASGTPIRTRELSFIISASVPPTITSQPTAQTVCAGGNAVFSVTATDASGYQWQVSTGGGPFTDISGATAASYTITGVTSGLNGTLYRVVVSSLCTSSVTSDAVILTVVNPVSITAHPVASEICSGSNTSFIVTGSSSQTIQYQWQVSTGGGPFTDISGANSSLLNITNASTSLSGTQYRCRLSNTTCSAPVYSNAALLTVRQLPAVTLSAAPFTALLPGQITTLTATPSASTGGTLSTAWFLNGAVISNSGNTRTVNVEQTGTYKVTILESFTGGITCINQSADLLITATESAQLFIFPSPNDGRFTVSYFNNDGTATQRRIVISDSKGALVYDKMFAVSGPYTLLPVHLPQASRGIYYVQIGDASGQKLATGKVHIR